MVYRSINSSSANFFPTQLCYALSVMAHDLPTLRVSGVAHKVRYRGENGFTILSAELSSAESSSSESSSMGAMEGSDDDATLIGPMPPIEKGDRFDAEVIVQTHPQYGYQYKVVQLLLKDLDALELTADGIMAYLEARVSGVGPKLARRIVEFFGDQTFEIIENSPEDLLKVPGVTRGTLQKITLSWDDRHGERRVLTALQSLGLSVTQAQRAMKHFGSSAPKTLEEDLYALTEVEGIGFLTADKLAEGRDIGKTDPRRLTAAAVYSLQQAQLSGGHSYLPLERLIRGITHYTQVGEKLAVEAVERAVERGRLKLEEDLETPEGGPREDRFLDRAARLGENGTFRASPLSGPVRVYLPYVHRTEVKLARLIFELLETDPETPWVVHKAALEGLSKEQSKVLRLLSDNRITVLTGGPGTGKSYTTRAVVNLAESLGLECALCAPTGKAARRLEEVTGRGASTIHRLLAYGPTGFRYGVAEPLGVDLVIVDEVSMCGDALLLSLLEALPEGSRILLVGDADQLPPVDYGMPLETLIAVAPTVKLEQVHRQAEGSPLIAAAHQIHAGRSPDFFMGEDLELLPLDPEGGARRLAMLVEKMGGPRAVQVLTPMRKGPLGVNTLNGMLQAQFNPGTGGLKVNDYMIRTGDIVVQTKNDYNNDVYNGTLGVVLTLEGNKAQVDFEGHVVELSGTEIYNLQLGYALTVHRAQGSEWNAVIGVLHEIHYNMLSRELAYTALTRARKRFVAAGSAKAWEMAAARHRDPRYSHLLERIKGRLESERASAMAEHIRRSIASG